MVREKFEAFAVRSSNPDGQLAPQKNREVRAQLDFLTDASAAHAASADSRVQ